MKDNRYLELEKHKFLQAYSQEAKRNNALLAKYPHNSRYQETDTNYEAMIESFDFLDNYISALHTRITLLEIENKMLHDDYAGKIEKDILSVDNLINKNGKNTKP